ncbi:tetratricopeptide repeat protein [Glaciecola sp. 1036]|uniref:tetratricopeptide repeat protein n=1 Tax=Alteromonadaceae TaxID=72275 RepID=UPI003D05BB0A
MEEQPTSPNEDLIQKAYSKYIKGYELMFGSDDDQMRAIEYFEDAQALYKKANSNDFLIPLLEHGKLLVEQRKYQEAETKFIAYLEASPDSAEVYNQLGFCRTQQGENRYTEAKYDYKRSIELYELVDSNDRQYPLKNCAELLRNIGEFQEAESLYRQGLKFGDIPMQAFLHNGLGLCLENQGEQGFDEAIEEYRISSQLYDSLASPDRVYPLKNCAELLRKIGEYREAESLYREGLKFGDKSMQAYLYNGLGICLQNQGDSKFDEAIENYKISSELYDSLASSDRIYPLRNWGNTLRLKGDYKAAEEKLREVVTIDDTYADAFNTLGICIERQDESRIKEALEYYKKSTELYTEQGLKDKKYSLRNWGLVLSYLGDYQAAEEKFREALSEDSTYADVYNDIGICFEVQGEEHFDDAIEEYRKSCLQYDINGHNGDKRYPLRNLGNLLRVQGDLKEAEEALLEAINVDETYAQAYNDLGLCLEEQGIERFEEAQEYYEKSIHWYIKTLPDQAFFPYGNLGVLHAKKGEYTSAFDYFEKAVKVNNSSPFPYHNLAHYQFKIGKYEEGWKNWRAAIARYNEAKSDKIDYYSLSDQNTLAQLITMLDADYAGAEALYLDVLEHDNTNLNALSGLAQLYYESLNSNAPVPAAGIGLDCYVKKTIAIYNARITKDDNWKDQIELADFYLKTGAFIDSEKVLEKCRSYIYDSPEKKVVFKIIEGLIHLNLERYKRAKNSFSEALRYEPSNIEAKTHLSDALFKMERFEAAESEYLKLLQLAPNNIDALTGYASLCIELADNGEVDRYCVAEENLTKAINVGYSTERGSKLLKDRELSEVYYLRGYARVRICETDSFSGNNVSLATAVKDFKQCKKHDDKNFKADAAIYKLNKTLNQQIKSKLVDTLGPLLISLLSVIVFILAQVDFFVAGSIGAEQGSILYQSRLSQEVYVVLTFSSLIFLTAGIYLPNVLKLKVGGIELEKGDVQQTSIKAMSIGITKSSSIGAAKS